MPLLALNINNNYNNYSNYKDNITSTPPSPHFAYINPYNNHQIPTSSPVSSTSSHTALGPATTLLELPSSSPPRSPSGPVDPFILHSELLDRSPSRPAPPSTSPAPAPASENYFELLATPTPHELPGAPPTERYELPAGPPMPTGGAVQVPSMSGPGSKTPRRHSGFSIFRSILRFGRRKTKQVQEVVV